jgi:hypothetical protein
MRRGGLGGVLRRFWVVPTAKWLSMKKTAPHGAPRRDIRLPWRQLLSLPIPCHVHWPRSYCQSRGRPPDICGKPCFRGPTGCMRGAGAFGSFLRAGCAGAVWVRGGSLGTCMRAGRRCLAPRVGGVRRWSGSATGSPSSDADTRARCADGHVGGWATLCRPAVWGRACVGAWAGAASGGSFGAFALVAVWGLPRLMHGGRILCRKVPNNAYSQDSQEFGASAGAY